MEASGSADAAWSSLVAGLRALGIHHAVYVTCTQGQQDIRLRSTLAFGPLPDLDHFDPFLKYCCDSYEATRTGVAYLDDYPYLDAGSRGFIAEAAGQGFTAGLGLPVRLRDHPRYGGFNLGTPLERAAFEREIVPLTGALRGLCLIAHRRFVELEDGQAANAPGAGGAQREVPQLTEREADVLFLLSLGQSRKDMARTCGVSVNTVSDYTKSLYAKLGVSGRFDAVERGRALGLVRTREFEARNAD